MHVLVCGRVNQSVVTHTALSFDELRALMIEWKYGSVIGWRPRRFAGDLICDTAGYGCGKL